MILSYILLFFLFSNLCIYIFFRIKYIIYDYIIVTCYFEDNTHSNRKVHSPETYRKWINNFFKNIKKNVVVFTDNVSLMKRYKPLKIIYYKDIELIPLNTNKSDLYHYQMKVDECDLERNWKTKMIWNSKFYFMNIATMNFNSHAYIWIDIGCIRDDKIYNNLPDIKKIKRITNNNEMNFFIVRSNPFIPYKIFSYKCLYVIATSFFGTKQAIQKFTKKFYEILDYNLENKIYFGTEQNLIDITLFKYFHYANIYELYKSKCQENSDFWKFFTFYSSYQCSEDVTSFKYFKNIKNISIEKSLECNC